jgi:plastocyanin
MSQGRQRVSARGQRSLMERGRRRYVFVVFAALAVVVSGTRALASSTTVTQSDFVFTPSTLRVSQGATLEVRNVTSSTPHTFTVSGQGIDIVNNPGQAHDVTINLPPGRYPFICRFHVSMGMRGTLVVEAAPSSPSPTSLSSATPNPIPSGGVQSGAGGTARPSPILPLGLGVGALLAALGALVLRRQARRQARG